MITLDILEHIVLHRNSCFNLHQDLAPEVQYLLLWLWYFCQKNLPYLNSENYWSIFKRNMRDTILNNADELYAAI